MKRACLLTVFLGCCGAVPHAQTGGSAAMLAVLKGLSGDWEGTLQWRGARTSRDTLTATYSVTGMGSAVVEDLIMDGQKSMTTVYHLDGSDLRMTHYCAAGNQPRLKATRVDAERQEAEFSFADATNLPDPDRGHVVDALIRVVSSDHVQLEFTFMANRERSVEHIDLKRVRGGKT